MDKKMNIVYRFMWMIGPNILLYLHANGTDISIIVTVILI